MMIESMKRNTRKFLISANQVNRHSPRRRASRLSVFRDLQQDTRLPSGDSDTGFSLSLPHHNASFDRWPHWEPLGLHRDRKRLVTSRAKIA